MGRMIWALVLLAALLTTGSPAAARPGRVEVALRATPEGVLAAWRLPGPTTRFEFQQTFEDIRPGWRVLTPGVSVAGDVVTSTTPIDRFEVLLPADDRDLVGKYPSAVRQGPDGWIVYTPYLVAKGETPTRITAGALPGQAIVQAGGPIRPGAALRTDGFVFIGPRAYLRAGPILMVIAPDAAPWLSTRVEADVRAVQAFYREKFGVGLSRRPVVMVGQTPASPRQTWVGDATPGGMVSLRFKGPGWETENDDLVRSVSLLVFHETAHFWNGSEFASHGEAPWLHEGAADYASMLAAVALGRETPRWLADQLGDRLTQCVNTSLPREWAKLTGWPPYQCGSLVHWVVDLELRRASAGRENFWTRWRDLFAESARRDHAYTAAQYLGPPALARSELIKLVLPLGENGSWRRFADGLEPFGVRLERPVAPDRQLRVDLLFRLMADDCPEGPRGFYTRPDNVQFDPSQVCKTMTAGMEVDAVEGKSLLTDVRGAWAAVAARCAAGQAVVFTRKGKAAATTPCPRPMPELTRSYVVTAMPGL